MHLACPDLPSSLNAGSILVTPNRLLASVAAEQYIQTQLKAGHDTWRPPQIFSSGAWLADCWQQARYAGSGVPTLLSPSQERAVWQDLIESEHPSLFDYKGAIGLAIAASRTMAEWHIPADGESWSAASDTVQFQRLLRLFRQRAGQQGWITRSDLWSLIPDWIGQSWWEKKNLTFAAFSSIPPALSAVLNRLGSQASIVPLAPAPKRKLAPLIECAGFPNELEFAARWIRHNLQDEAPLKSIALFIPNLATHKQLVARTLQRVFQSGDLLGAPSSDVVFHLHASQPLAEHPLVVSALLFLELGLPRLSISDAGAILRSPFLGKASQERNLRALSDTLLRRYRDLEVTLFDIEKSSSQSPKLLLLLAQVRRLLKSLPEDQDAADWSESFAGLLSAAGWPGDHELSASEQEVIEDWKAALSDLAALGLVLPRLSLPAALSQLRVILASRTIETGNLASPVQVLDASAASGLRFDMAAIAGLSEEAWPPPFRTSPFLPIQLQRPQIAATAPERAKATEALFATSPSTLVLHSGHLAPAARTFVRSRKSDLPVWSGLLPGQAPPTLASDDPLEDGAAPPFHVTGVSTPGGVSILKSQSQCPFQAFAKYRLAARSPEEACFGFDARDRGTFLHRALENVWRDLQTRDRLKATSFVDRRNLVHQAVAAAVGQHEDSSFHQLAGEAERTRLEEVILEWLTLEEGRDQPFTVEHIEKDQSLQISGLPLNLRIDRVDRLRDGSAVLIDYKSGEPKLKSLEGERPSEPQLLVYASAMNEPVEGLFFAQLKPRALKAVGWSRTSQFPVKGRSRKNTRFDWDNFLQSSNDAVQKIASEFIAGLAVVDPQPGACTFCNLKPFCRINEQSSVREDSDDAD